MYYVNILTTVRTYFDFFTGMTIYAPM